MKLDREECISELDTKIKYAKFANTNAVVLSSKAAQFCLEHAQYYEQKIKELTEENERLKELGTTKEIEKEIVRRETRSDTVRKMQVLLHKKANYKVCGYYCVSTDDIDEIAKEIINEKIHSD